MLLIHKQIYSFLMNDHANQKERLFYAFFECLEQNFILFKPMEKIIIPWL